MQGSLECGKRVPSLDAVARTRKFAAVAVSKRVGVAGNST
jgi:hypothetical protein